MSEEQALKNSSADIFECEIQTNKKEIESELNKK